MPLRYSLQGMMVRWTKTVATEVECNTQPRYGLKVEPKRRADGLEVRVFDPAAGRMVIN